MELFVEKATVLDKASRTLTQDDKALLVRFKLMSAETQNENNRIYPRGVLAKAVEDLKARLAKRKSSFAMNTHLDDENVDDVAAVLEDVEMSGDDVYATAKVVPTAKGRNIMALLKNGAAVGVSAKCFGKVEKGIVQPGVILKGFDFCLDPGFGTFVGKSNILESVSVPGEEDNTGAVTLEELQKFGLIEDGQQKVEESILRQRYENAVRLAGYKGDFESYRKLFEKG